MMNPAQRERESYEGAVPEAFCEHPDPIDLNLDVHQSLIHAAENIFPRAPRDTAD